MDKAYTSVFQNFMNQFLHSHTETVEEQQRNWREFWEPDFDPRSGHARLEDVVADDHYGFH